MELLGGAASTQWGPTIGLTIVCGSGSILLLQDSAANALANGLYAGVRTITPFSLTTQGTIYIGPLGVLSTPNAFLITQPGAVTTSVAFTNVGYASGVLPTRFANGGFSFRVTHASGGSLYATGDATSIVTNPGSSVYLWVQGNTKMVSLFKYVCVFSDRSLARSVWWWTDASLRSRLSRVAPLCRQVDEHGDGV